MFMRVAVLLFLFLARIRFPRNESIASIVRKRYSGEILKTIPKFEKVDYKLRKARLDINFLNANEKTSYQTFFSFVWLIKIFEILLPILNVNRISYKQKLTIRNHV